MTLMEAASDRVSAESPVADAGETCTAGEGVAEDGLTRAEAEACGDVPGDAASTAPPDGDDASCGACDATGPFPFGLSETLPAGGATCERTTNQATIAATKSTRAVAVVRCGFIVWKYRL